MGKHIMTITAAMLAALSLSGCGLTGSALAEYTMPEGSVGERSVTEDGLNASINAEHEKLTLDGGFLEAQGYDAEEFSSCSGYVTSGVAEALAGYEAAEARFEYWSAVIGGIDADAMAGDFDAAYRSLTGQMTDLAAQCQMSLYGYAAEHGLSQPDLDALLADMAEGISCGKSPSGLLEELEQEAEDALAGLKEAYGAAGE